MLALWAGKWTHVKEATEIGEGKLFSLGNWRETFDNPEYEKVFYHLHVYFIITPLNSLPDRNAYFIIILLIALPERKI